MGAELTLEWVRVGKRGFQMKTIRAMVLIVTVAIASTCADLSTASAQDANYYLEGCRNYANDKYSQELVVQQSGCAATISALLCSKEHNTPANG